MMGDELDALLNQIKNEERHRTAAQKWLKKAEETALSAGPLPHGDDSRDTIQVALCAVRIADLHIKLADWLAAK